jgi:polynucleotide 5'-kinase involved in rRNA processing
LKVKKIYNWLKQSNASEAQLKFSNVISGLKSVYKSKILPLEDEFHSPKLEDADFEAKPMILLIGQYSTGKTTFIKYLLERDFPGIE